MLNTPLTRPIVSLAPEMRTAAVPGPALACKMGSLPNVTLLESNAASALPEEPAELFAQYACAPRDALALVVRKRPPPCPSVAALSVMLVAVGSVSLEEAA